MTAVDVTGTAGRAPGTGEVPGTGEALGYRVVVPDEWFTVDLDPVDRLRSVAALVKRQFRGAENVPHLKAQARRELGARARAAYQAGGLELYVSLQEAAGIPLAASLVTFLIPAPGDGSTTTAAGLAQARRADGHEVGVVDLPAGTAVRELRRALPGGEHAEPATTLAVFVPVPGSGTWLLLSFSTPLAPLAPALTRLFDAICTTLRWVR